MTSFELKWDISKVLRRVASGTASAAITLNTELRKAIITPQYAWPRSPSPRAIVRTGRFRDSQQIARVSATQYQYSWPVPYAKYIRNGTSRMPGRDYIGRAIRRRGIIRNAFVTGYKRG